MIKAMAELLNDGETVFIGLNSSIPYIASFMARDYYKKNIRILGVFEADNPQAFPLAPSTGNTQLAETSSILTTYDAFDLAQKGRLDVMFLGPAQIDDKGNVNISVIGSYEKPKVRLPGGAATAFLVPIVKKNIFWNTKYSKRIAVKKVDFITGSFSESNNEAYLVTNLGVLKYLRKDKCWEVIAIYDNTNYDVIANNTDFCLRKSENIRIITLTEGEKEFIEKIDPYSLRSTQET